MSILTDEALRNFDLKGEVEKVYPYGDGHINDTYKVETTETAYILQRINKFVFPNPPEIMENIISVTKYLKDSIVKNGGDPERETLTFLPAKDGKYYYIDNEGEYWRLMYFLTNSVAPDLDSGADVLEESGFAFGQFQNLLADYPADTLHEVIKDFHNTPARFKQLEDAIAENKTGRADEVKKEIEFAFARKEAASELMDLLNAGKLPLKVTHNDTKTNNVLMDATSKKAICVIDLDTVMPGLTAFDYGDSIRTGASTAAEDEVDLSKVSFSPELFESYTKGFLRAAGKSLTETELLTLPVGAKLMTYEVGLRFLADYINGDVYFKTKYPQHNLDRARNQFKLVEDIENKWDEFMAIIKKYA